MRCRFRLAQTRWKYIQNLRLKPDWSQFRNWKKASLNFRSFMTTLLWSRWFFYWRSDVNSVFIRKNNWIFRLFDWLVYFLKLDFSTFSMGDEFNRFRKDYQCMRIVSFIIFNNFSNTHRNIFIFIQTSTHIAISILQQK